MAITKKCEKCDNLLSKYGFCARPSLNGRAVKLNKNAAGIYIPVCGNEKVKSCDCDVEFCNLECFYLNKDYGICSRPELNGKGKTLKKYGKNFQKECSCNNQDFLQSKHKNKYNAKKVTVNGINYDSKLEYERHCQLLLLQRAGVVSDVQYHVRFPLIEKDKHGREIAYEADFVYFENGTKIVEDVKSAPTKTRVYALKKRLMLEKYGIKIKEYFKEG